MKNSIFLPLLTSSTLALVACGGGGSYTQPPAPRALGGTVAVGAPIRGATVDVFDTQGQRVAQAQTGIDGKYQVQLPSAAQGPFLIKASYADEALFSVHDGQGEVANVSHLTDAVTAMLSPTGAADGLMLSTQSLASVSNDQIVQAASKVQAAVAPVADAIDDLPAGASFMSTAFDANGTGLDRLLDAASLSVTAKQSADTVATNIGVAFNVTQGVNALDASRFVAFSSLDSAAEIQGKVSGLTVSANQLPPSRVGQLYLDLISRLNACYAIPVAQRVEGDTITSQACRNLFYNADPGQYRDGGFNARQRFSSLFTATGRIEFKPTMAPIIAQDLAGDSATGRAVVAAKGQDTQGNYSYNRFYVRTFNLNGQTVLGIEGDQNPFEFYVNAENEYRTFPLSKLSLDMIQSQFALILRVPTEGTRVPTAAIVTGPSGRFLMAPITGRDNFRLCRQMDVNEITPEEIRIAPNGCKGAPLLVHASEFVNNQASLPIASPLDFDHVKRDFLIVKDNNDRLLTDTDVEKIPNGATWQATVFFNEGPNQVVYTRNAGRPMSSAELRGADSPMSRAAQFSRLTLSEGSNKPARVVDFSQALPLNPNAGITSGQDLYKRFADARTPVWAPVEGGFKFDWTVSPSQIPPFLVFVSGQVRINSQGQDVPLLSNRQPFEDTGRFSVAARSTQVFCSPSSTQTLADQSCDLILDDDDKPIAYAKDGADKYLYNPGTWMTSTSLISRDQQQRSIIRGYMWFIPTRNNGTFIE